MRGLLGDLLGEALLSGEDRITPRGHVQLHAIQVLAESRIHGTVETRTIRRFFAGFQSGIGWEEVDRGSTG